MKVCICRNVSDSTIKQVLSEKFKGIRLIPKRRGDSDDQTQEAHNLDDLHEACSSGEGFNCGKCACHMGEIVDDHNHQVIMSEIGGNMSTPDMPAAETPAALNTKPNMPLGRP